MTKSDVHQQAREEAHDLAVLAKDLQDRINRANPDDPAPFKFALQDIDRIQKCTRYLRRPVKRLKYRQTSWFYSTRWWYGFFTGLAFSVVVAILYLALS